MPGFTALRLLPIAVVGASLLPAIASAQVAGPVEPPPKTRSVIVYGDDPCPASSGDEIVVCARQPEGERYRIPKQFRGRKAARSPAGNAWSNKVTGTEEASRAAAGVPNSCSAVGSAGQSGCFLQMQRAAAADR